jgi:hypothetical protein
MENFVFSIFLEWYDYFYSFKEKTNITLTKSFFFLFQFTLALL